MYVILSYYYHDTKPELQFVDGDDIKKLLRFACDPLRESQEIEVWCTDNEPKLLYSSIKKPDATAAVEEE